VDYDPKAPRIAERARGESPRVADRDSTWSTSRSVADARPDPLSFVAAVRAPLSEHAPGLGANANGSASRL